MNYIVITDEAHRAVVMALSSSHTLWWTDANGKVAVAGFFAVEPTGYTHFAYNGSAMGDWRNSAGWVDRPEYDGTAVYINSHAFDYMAMANPIFGGWTLQTSLPAQFLGTTGTPVSDNRTAAGKQLNVLGVSAGNMLFSDYTGSIYLTENIHDFITILPDLWQCHETVDYTTDFIVQRLHAPVYTYHSADPGGIGADFRVLPFTTYEEVSTEWCNAAGSGAALYDTIEFYSPVNDHPSGSNGYVTGAFGFLYAVRYEYGWSVWDVRAAYRVSASNKGVYDSLTGGYGMIQMQEAEALGPDAGALPLYGPVELAVRLRDNLELKWRNFRQSRWNRTKLVMYASEPTPGVTRPSDGITVYDGTGEYTCVAADTSNAGNLWIAGFSLDAAGNASVLQACDVIRVPARTGNYRNPIAPAISSDSDGSYRAAFTPNPHASAVDLFYCGEGADVAACLDKTPDQLRLVKSYANTSPIIIGKSEYGSLNALHPIFVLVGRDSGGSYGSTEEVCALSMTLTPKSLGARMEGVNR